MKTPLTILALLLCAPSIHAAEGVAPRVKMRPKLRPATNSPATAAWRRAGGLQAGGKVTAFEYRVLQRMARLPKLEIQRAGEVVGHSKDRFGYPIRYALKRFGDSLSFSITRHNAYRDPAGSVRFTQGSDGGVEREVHLRAPGREALFRRSPQGKVGVAHHGGSMASGTNGFAEVRMQPPTKRDLQLLRSVLRERNADFKKTPFDRWYAHAAGY